MKTGKKIWICISGLLLIALGVICIMRPDITLLSTAWVLGLLTLFSGIFRMVFTFRTQAFLPNSASRILMALLEIFFGLSILFNILGAAISLPVMFACWVIIEGISVAVQSFDYKKLGFPLWWAILILGIGLINFTNFYVALTPLRIRSVNLQKILGSSTARLRALVVAEGGGEGVDGLQFLHNGFGLFDRLRVS